MAWMNPHGMTLLSLNVAPLLGHSIMVNNLTIYNIVIIGYRCDLTYVICIPAQGWPNG